MDNSKRLTLEALMAKAEQRKQEKYEIRQVEVPSLGGALQLEKIPLTRIASMMDDLGDTSMAANLAFNVDLIYACCPMLRNTKLQAAYEVAAPTDIVCAVLGDNMMEINRIVTAILDMYGLADATGIKDAVKN